MGLGEPLAVEAPEGRGLSSARHRRWHRSSTRRAGRLGHHSGRVAGLTRSLLVLTKPKSHAHSKQFSRKNASADRSAGADAFSPAPVFSGKEYLRTRVELILQWCKGYNPSSMTCLAAAIFTPWLHGGIVLQKHVKLLNPVLGGLVGRCERPRSVTPLAFFRSEVYCGVVWSWEGGLGHSMWCCVACSKVLWGSRHIDLFWKL